MVISNLSWFANLYVNLIYVSSARCLYCGTVFVYRESLYHNNNTVDLHGLHVDEALEVLETLLAQREQGRYHILSVQH